MPKAGAHALNNTGLFTRFAQIGRVVLVQYGPDAGKLATIIDIVDHNRALVDGPETLTGVRRQVINFKWIALTDFVVPAPRNARAKTLAAAWAKEGTLEKWQKSAWAKKALAKTAKAASTDLQRFQAKLKQQRVSAAVKKAIKA